VGVGLGLGETVGVGVSTPDGTGVEVGMAVSVPVAVDDGVDGGSVAVAVKAGPQRAVLIWQSALQTGLPPPLKPRLSHVTLGSKGPSHCSTRTSTTPSPQRAGRQADVHASLSLVLPSSQTSPVLMTPLPQVAKFWEESPPPHAATAARRTHTRR
jgi:hypothetical protein